MTDHPGPIDARLVPPTIPCAEGDTVLFDVDGTLAQLDLDLADRTVHRPDKDWHGFFAEADASPVIAPVRRLARILRAGGQRVVVCTGRPESFRARTRAWLERHDIPFEALYLRPETQDRWPDEEVKEALLETLLSDGFRPWLVVDDRDSVVAFWRGRNLCCLQATPGDF